MTTVTRRSAAALAALTLAGTLAVPTLAFADVSSESIDAYYAEHPECVRSDASAAAITKLLEANEKYPNGSSHYDGLLIEVMGMDQYATIVGSDEEVFKAQYANDDDWFHSGLKWAATTGIDQHKTSGGWWELVRWEENDGDTNLTHSSFAQTDAYKAGIIELISGAGGPANEFRYLNVWTINTAKKAELDEALRQELVSIASEVEAACQQQDTPSEDPADNPADNPSDDPTDDATAGDDSQDTTDGDSTDNATAGDDATTGTTAGTGAGTAAGAGGSGAVNTYSAGTTSGSGLAKTGAALGTLAIAAGAAGAGGLALRRYTK